MTGNDGTANVNVTSPDYRKLLQRSLIALGICAVLVTLCYFFVDRPVAFFVHDQRINHNSILPWLTYPSSWAERIVSAVLVSMFIRRAWGPFQRWELAVIAACVALLLAQQFRLWLGFLAGRYWPETWIQNNPSLIHDGAYGFHPFSSGVIYGSFPSGHTARTLAVVTIFWLVYPRWRWLCVLASLAVAVGLVGMNFHFVGDVIAGGVVGGIVGAYVAVFFELNRSARGQGHDHRFDGGLGIGQDDSGEGSGRSTGVALPRR